MGSVYVENFDDHFFRYTLPVAIVQGRVLNAIQSNFTDPNNIQWNVSRTSGYVSSITIQTAHDVALTEEMIIEMMEYLGLTECVEPENNLMSFLENGDNFRLGVSDPGPAVAYPYIRIQRADSFPNPSNHTVNLTTNLQVNSSQGYTIGASANILDSPGPLACIIGIKDGEDFVYGSCSLSSFTLYGLTSCTITIEYMMTGITSNNYPAPDYDPGDKGFRPTAARTKNEKPGIGGRPANHKKDPDYAGDSVTQPGAPDESVASAVGSGFLNCYQIDTSNLHKVGQCLYGSTLLGLIQSLSLNPLDFIISLMVFPCTPDVGSSENVKLGGWIAAATGGAALGFDATGNKLSKQFKVYDFGTLSIPENWGNFLDYSQTAVELYLPFIGSINLDVSECMGGTVNVQYTVDFFTGMCVANVLCTKPVMLPSGKVLSNIHAQHSFQGNCAVQIPLSAINYGSMVGSLINACTQGITNPVQGFAGIAADAIGGGFRPNVTSKGNIVANAGFCSVLYPYIRLTRPITAEPETYQEVIGYPSYINTSLGMCEGLCVCDDIDLSGIVGATDSELERMRQLCMDGVIV